MTRFYRRWLTHLSTVSLALTILAGAFVHATGSGLACPDWPLCLGTFFPEMTGAVLFEHSHRLIAGATGVIVWVTGIVHLASDSSRTVKVLSAILMVSIVVQAVLGGLTVLYQLPGWISTLHFLLAHLTFAGMFYLSWTFFRSGHRPVPDFTGGERRLGLATLVVVFSQMGLGAWLRHIGSKGPPLQDLTENFPWNEALWLNYMPFYYLSTYWIHRGAAVLVTVLIVWLALRELRIRGHRSTDFLLSFASGIVVLVQVILGVLSVRASLSVLFVMFHTAGALLLFTFFLQKNFRYLEASVEEP